jgi:hypothetical protein
MNEFQSQRLAEAEAFLREFAMTEDRRFPRPDTTRTLPPNVIDLAQYRRQRCGAPLPIRSA